MRLTWGRARPGRTPASRTASGAPLARLPREFLDRSRDNHWLDPRQRNAVAPAVGEPSSSDQIGMPRVRVPDMGGEEFPESPPRPARGAEQRRRRLARDPHRDRSAACGIRDDQGVFRADEHSPLLKYYKGHYVWLRFRNYHPPQTGLEPPVFRRCPFRGSPRVSASIRSTDSNPTTLRRGMMT